MKKTLALFFFLPALSFSQTQRVSCDDVFEVRQFGQLVEGSGYYLTLVHSRNAKSNQDPRSIKIIERGRKRFLDRNIETIEEFAALEETSVIKHYQKLSAYLRLNCRKGYRPYHIGQEIRVVRIHRLLQRINEDDWYSYEAARFDDFSPSKAN